MERGGARTKNIQNLNVISWKVEILELLRMPTRLMEVWPANDLSGCEQSLRQLRAPAWPVLHSFGETHPQNETSRHY